MSLATVMSRDLWADPFAAAQKEFDRLLKSDLAGAPLGVLSAMPCDITETEAAYEIDADMPGFERGDINVAASDGLLTISAEREESRGGKRHVKERRHTSIHRQFSLPGGVDPDAVQARLKNGVLHVTIRKSPQASARRVEIK